MKKKFPVTFKGVIAIITACLIAYYVLLCPNMMHSSIAEIADYLDDLEVTQHLLVLGLLPIYIAAIVFGAVMFGIFLGSLLQNLFFKTIKN